MVMMRGVLSPGPRGTVAVAPVPVTGLKSKDHLIGVFIIANYDGILLFIV
jgi:hypothetical protein